MHVIWFPEKEVKEKKIFGTEKISGRKKYLKTQYPKTSPIWWKAPSKFTKFSAHQIGLTQKINIPG